MAPAHHLTWFADNISWFSAIDGDSLSTVVPNCPGWTVEKVVTHLTYGLGRAYPLAMACGPSTPADQAFAGMSWPESLPTGQAALDALGHELGRCLATFRVTDAAEPCWTYVGAGTASFWFRRAAIETALHRIDVADALGSADPVLEIERTVDAIAEAVDIILPLAARITQAEPDAVTIIERGSGKRFSLGPGVPSAEISGHGQALLEALWGRTRPLEITGDRTAAYRWLQLVEQAFAGR